MTQAGQSYTPVSRPLPYESILAKEGEETISGGVEHCGFKVFNKLDVQPHTADAESIFNRADTYCIAPGPSAPLESEMPQLYDWTSWVAGEHVRAGKGILEPNDFNGQISRLWENDNPNKVSHAFSYAGMLGIAIQNRSWEVALAYYIDGSGSFNTTTWEGNSPCYFCIDRATNTLGTNGMVCLFLRPEAPHSIFARFGQDDYDEDREIISGFRAHLSRLIACELIANKVKLYAQDNLGRDITLTSASYV